MPLEKESLLGRDLVRLWVEFVNTVREVERHGKRKSFVLRNLVLNGFRTSWTTSSGGFYSAVNTMLVTSILTFAFTHNHILSLPSIYLTAFVSGASSDCLPTIQMAGRRSSPATQGH